MSSAIQGGIADIDARSADADLERVLLDLHRELRGLLAELPVEAQSVGGLARNLGIERTTCHRVVSAATRPFSGIRLATLLPGTRGLRMVADAAAARGGSVADAAARVRAAIDDYARLIRRVAGTRSKLLAQLAAQGEQARAPVELRDRGVAAREALFSAAEALTGRSSETWLAAHLYEPRGDDDAPLVQSRVHGLIGHRWRSDAVPLTFHVISQDEGADAVAGKPRRQLWPLLDEADGAAPRELLRGFSSSPPPVVRTQQPNEFLVQAIDPHPTQVGGPVDVLFGLVGDMLHPSKTPTRLEEVWALVNFPARRLLLDVFLHKSLARTSLASLDVHLWRPDFAKRTGERWQTRFADAPPLQLIGAGLRGAATHAYARHAALLQFLFECRKLDPQDYVGYRVDVAYPMWRTGYCLTLDFGAEP